MYPALDRLRPSIDPTHAATFYAMLAAARRPGTPYVILGTAPRPIRVEYTPPCPGLPYGAFWWTVYGPDGRHLTEWREIPGVSVNPFAHGVHT